jgi:hypothetical protein
MGSVTLWSLDRTQGKYLVADECGTVLLGPFYSHHDPLVVGQRLANTMKLQVEHRPLLAADGELLHNVFFPVERLTRKVRL